MSQDYPSRKVIKAKRRLNENATVPQNFYVPDPKSRPPEARTTLGIKRAYTTETPTKKNLASDRLKKLRTELAQQVASSPQQSAKPVVSTPSSAQKIQSPTFSVKQVVNGARPVVTASSSAQRAQSPMISAKRDVRDTTVFYKPAPNTPKTPTISPATPIISPATRTISPATPTVSPATPTISPASPSSSPKNQSPLVLAAKQAFAQIASIFRPGALSTSKSPTVLPISPKASSDTKPEGSSSSLCGQKRKSSGNQSDCVIDPKKKSLVISPTSSQSHRLTKYKKSANLQQAVSSPQSTVQVQQAVLKLQERQGTEEMDWSDSDVNSDTGPIDSRTSNNRPENDDNNVNRHAGPSDSRTSNNTPEKKISVTPSSNSLRKLAARSEIVRDSDTKDRNKLFIVVDTNIFISQLDIICKILAMRTEEEVQFSNEYWRLKIRLDDVNIHVENYPDQHSFHGEKNLARTVIGPLKPVIFVPWIVIEELDYFKEDSVTSKCKWAAQKAIKLINEALEKRNGRILGQTLDEVNEQRNLGKKQDDKIIACCLQVLEKHGNMILLSSDINLKNKALINNIPVCSHSEIIARISSASKVDGTAIIAKRRSKQNRMLEKMLDIFWNVIQICAFKAYGDKWNKLHLLDKQPTSIGGCIKIFQKYWISVFDDFLMKQFKNALDGFSSFCETHSDLTDDSEDLNQLAVLCVRVCIFFKDIAECKRLVENTIRDINDIRDS